MKLIKTTGMVALAFGLVAMFAGAARAQDPNVPIVTHTVSGTSVNIQWTAVPGATSYDIIVTGAMNGQVQLPTTFVTVNAPVGNYNVQVRGRNGGTVGPLSAVRPITVGGAPTPPPLGPCTGAPAPPTVTATGSFASVAVSWTPVAGATSYAVQFTRTAGITEVTVPVPGSQTSTNQPVGFAGTFIVRVVAITACGNSTSADASFTTGVSTGARTPNPASGQLIPRGTLGYANGIVRQVASQYRGDLINSCRDTGGNNVFMFRLVAALRSVDTRWGMNDKRGNRGDMSQDIVSYNPTDRADNGESQVYLFDAIGGHCGNNPVADSLSDVTDVTWAQRGNPACGTTYCARWTIDQYLQAGFPADPRQ
jgi:hypothetical protein